MTNKNRQNKEQCTYQRDGIGCINSSHGGGRGLCNTHYSLCSYHVKKGNKTWEQYEEEGVCVRKMTQLEKNMHQSHPHKSYITKKGLVKGIDTSGMEVEPNPDF